MRRRADSGLAPLRRQLAARQHDWWRRYRWPALLLIAAVWLPVLLLAVATGWNVLSAFGIGCPGGG